MLNAEFLMLNNLLLYAISDGGLDAIEQAINGGITMLQLRAKGLPDSELLALARRVKELTDRFHVPLIINDRADIAVEIGAAGAHLGLGDGDLRAARALLGPGKILGATARTVDQALAAQAAGADYLGCGAVFGTRTKSDAVPMPLGLFKEICAGVKIPVVAIGGIDRTNIARLKGRGMAGFAIASGIFGRESVGQATRELRDTAKDILKGERV
jgi:thiamine-phosphate pyrophosphorylase